MKKLNFASIPVFSPFQALLSKHFSALQWYALSVFILVKRPMRTSTLLGLAFTAAILLCSCSSEPTKRYFPPQASLQQLQRLANGQWQAQVRIQNFSTGAVEFKNLALDVQIQDLEWTTIAPAEAQKIGPNNAEIFTLSIPFNAVTSKVLSERLAKSQSIRYTLKGNIHSINPNKTYPLDYQGRLNPAPGLDGVYR
jgi:hypothetical protein